MKARVFRGLFGALVLACSTLAGCSDEGQRSCPSDFTCADLVTNTCGESGACASSQSCVAAKKLEQSGDQASCEAAWCSLGESYKECE
ncbi:hypothetical protein [Polyangium sp. 15x6]|uniref:hypothetical protein n=1 Tax=Polyangium sp. 15x6 TaxID=3042687 RepID=UPI00249C7866|nr:hypothetical protein [Polyangium sp. 15x6]MDI3285243.1 hypothetical protein [Polyangium sp. 15x6]